MAELDKILENQIVVSLLLLIIGGMITLIFSKISNKTSIFRYYTSSTKVGVSADDEVFGTVRSTWQGHDMRNLYISTIEVQNTSSKDFENIKFKVYSGEQTLLLNQRTEIVGTPDIIPWDKAYSQRIHIAEGEEATDSQVEEYRHNREYNLPVFNRGQTIRFSYLCTNPNDDDEPGVYISSYSKGIKLKSSTTPYLILNPIFGVPIPVAITRALFISALVVIACGLWIDNIWIASSLSMFVGLTGQIFGAIEYKIERFIINTVSG